MDPMLQLRTTLKMSAIFSKNVSRSNKGENYLFICLDVSIFSCKTFLDKLLSRQTLLFQLYQSVCWKKIAYWKRNSTLIWFSSLSTMVAVRGCSLIGFRSCAAMSLSAACTAAILSSNCLRCVAALPTRSISPLSAEFSSPTWSDTSSQ